MSLKDDNTKLESPIFIIGDTRSGTTTLSKSILLATEYSGWDEGHCLRVLPKLMMQIDEFENEVSKLKKYYAFQATYFDLDSLRQNIMNNFKEQVDSFYVDGQAWIDKTPHPSMVLAAPYILEMWPSAKFIFMKRRPIENIQSKLRKFPAGRFEVLCKSWAKTMSNWHKVKSDIGDDKYLEIDQMDLVNNLDEVSGKLCDFLKINPKQKSTLHDILKNSEYSKTTIGDYKTIPLDDTGWSRHQKRIFLDNCADIADKCGYALDNRYFKTD